MKPVNLVIYHSADFDGIACREVARLHLGASADYVGWNYGEPAPSTDGYSVVYMLDCSVPELMDNDRLIWIDHHATQIAQYPATIAGYRIDGVAACRLLWQWFRHPLEHGHPNKTDYVERVVLEPLAIRLIGEYDVWDQRDPRAALFQHGLRSQPVRWEALLHVAGYVRSCAEQYVEELLKAGKYVAYAAGESRAQLMAESAFTLQWAGLCWLAVNGGPSLSSHAYASAIQPEHDACLSWGWVPKIGAYKVSLRGVPHKPEIDLSAIASMHGGGGHKQACGFSARLLPWLSQPSVYMLAGDDWSTEDPFQWLNEASYADGVHVVEAEAWMRLPKHYFVWSVDDAAVNRKDRQKILLETTNEAEAKRVAAAALAARTALSLGGAA